VTSRINFSLFRQCEIENFSTFENVRRWQTYALIVNNVSKFSKLFSQHISSSIIIPPPDREGHCKLSAVCLSVRLSRALISLEKGKAWEAQIGQDGSLSHGWPVSLFRNQKNQRPINAHTVNAQYLPNRKAYELDKAVTSKVKGQRSRSPGLYTIYIYDYAEAAITTAAFNLFIFCLFCY